MDLSCAFPTSIDTPEHIAIAEKIGYKRAWCYDSPGVYADVWMALALAAKQTERIGLGPAVLVPSLRHPMTNAAAIATLAALAPGRVAVAIGTGFTGRVVMGQRALPWKYVREYIAVLQGLLRGETVEWDGAAMRMIHTPGVVADRPVDAPIVIAANGPKGQAVAAELADGVMFAGPIGGAKFTIPPETKPWRPVGAVWGTVLDEGEDLASDRVIDAVGPALAVTYHGAYSFVGAAAVDRLPGGEAWRAVVEETPGPERHLTVHEGHLCTVTEHDRQAAIAASPMVTATTFSGTAAELKAKAEKIEEIGGSELIYQPAGSDIPRELERMWTALNS